MSAAPARADDFTSIFISAPDGLQLHARCIGPRRGTSLPVVCLPGLTRTANDFDTLARALAHADPDRRVISVDYRGRGRSDYDRNPGNYNPAVELADLIAVLAALEAAPAIFVGTSRGGILTMLLAATRPDAIAAAVLNDIGPVIELEGLMRIKGYVGRVPEPEDYADAARILRRFFEVQFPKLSDEDWLTSAKRGFREQDGQLVPTYDVNLARTLDSVTPDMPSPTLWPQFDALGGVPVMVIRGALSDLLSERTVEMMRERHRSLEVIEVADQGHPPLLTDSDIVSRIVAFMAGIRAPRAAVR
jgi:pimeloyl-ACP methyl ester carboxylesterase